ncbi:recombinase RecX [Polaribacter pacificus]|uniref:Regulatory protein RecX n=1 Tax=Polaribacter pacificus TaxID=1775173 RepID=A0A917MEW8_9FLAO|nr:regulatory protein RecX [Polaribacter pacificus]GGG94647.1 recombinase RecX [Polaribacter pacificus]
MQQKKYFSIEEITRKLERYCVYQDRCHQEIEKKLSEFTLIPEARDQIIFHLLEHNFLNEERFSKSFARGKFNIKKWGKTIIVNELKRREVSAYNIKTALNEIDEETYLKTLYELAEKRHQLRKEKDWYAHKKKLVDFLIRKGYEYDLIFKVVDELLNDSKP